MDMYVCGLLVELESGVCVYVGWVRVERSRPGWLDDRPADSWTHLEQRDDAGGLERLDHRARHERDVVRRRGVQAMCWLGVIEPKGVGSDGREWMLRGPPFPNNQILHD